MFSPALGPLFQRDKFIFGGIENFDGVHRVDFPDGATRKGVWSHEPAARTWRVTAIEEKLSGDSHPLPSDRKRVGHMRRGALVRIESIPQRGPEVGDDFCCHTGTFFSRSRLTQRNVNIIPVKERVVTVDALAFEALRTGSKHVGVVVLCVEHKCLERDQVALAQSNRVAIYINGRKSLQLCPIRRLWRFVAVTEITLLDQLIDSGL